VSIQKDYLQGKVRGDRLR